MTTGQPAEIRPPAAVNSGLRARLCRVFLILFVVAAAWALAVALTGGFALNFGLFRLKSRSPRNAMIIAALIGVLAGLLATPGHRRQALAAELDLFLRGSTVPHASPYGSRPSGGHHGHRGGRARIMEGRIRRGRCRFVRLL